MTLAADVARGSRLRPALRIAARGLAVAGIVLSAVWVGLALWFQLPMGRSMVAVVLGLWLAFVLAVLAFEVTTGSARAKIVYCLVLAAVAAWWAIILPSNSRYWANDVAHGVTGTVDGDLVQLWNVRNFDWRSEDDYVPRWESRTVDLSKLETVDLFLSYWSGPAIAHTLVSFGFEDGDHVVFSAEIRKEHDEVYSTLGGFFKEFELALIAADEGDIIRLRTNARGEDVYRYPLEMPQAGMRALFLSYVELGNELARKARFYNTVTANCTTVVFRLIRALDPGLPLDYRILLSGYLPGYIYDRQGHPPGQSLADFMAAAAVGELGREAGDAADYSARIRASAPQD